MPVALSSEVVVNTATSGDQRLADTAALSGDRTVVAWIDEGAGGVAKVRLLGPDGAPASGEIALGAARDVQAAGLAGGGFVVVWIEAGDGQTAVRAQAFDAAGLPSGAVQTLDSSATSGPAILSLEYVGLQALSLPDGGYAIGWAALRSDNFANHSVLNRLVVTDAGGSVEANLSLPAAQASKTLPLYDPSPALAELSGSRFLLTWRQAPTSIDLGGQMGQVYDFQGAPQGDLLRLDPAFPADGGPVIEATQGLGVAAVGGRVAFAWKAGDDVWVSVYPEAGLGLGNLTGRSLPVRLTSEAGEGEPSVAALADDRFVVAWSAGGDAYGRILDAAGAPAGDAFRIGQIPEGVQDLAQLVVRPDGYVVAAWRDDSQEAPPGQPADTSGDGVKAQILSLGVGQTGQPTDDTLTGGAAPDPLSGGGGDDRLVGLAGNDTLDGGMGADSLVGGGGDDLLVGGNGYDYAEFAVSVTADLLAGRVLGEGADTLSGVEGVRGSAFADTLSGNYLGNVISGGAGDDVVAGGVGAGFLDGGPGSDTLALVGTLSDYFVDGPTLTGPWGVTSAFGFEAVQIAGQVMTWAQFAAQAFDALRYIASNPDLIVAYQGDAAAGLRHWLLQGQGEDRALATFDPFRYGASNPDLLFHYGADPRALTLHYVWTGFTEGRPTDAFDSLAYGAAHADLLRAFGVDEAALARHFAATGIGEGRPVSGFDPVAYLLTYDDLARAGLGVDGAYRHWLVQGAVEERRGDELFGRDQTDHQLAAGASVSDELRNRGGERPATDRDWFSLDLAAGQQVSVSVAGAGADAVADPRLEIFDATGRRLAAEDDGRIDITAVSAGAYYVVVSSPTGDEGPYVLGVTGLAAPADGWIT